MYFDVPSDPSPTPYVSMTSICLASSSAVLISYCPPAILCLQSFSSLAPASPPLVTLPHSAAAFPVEPI